MTITTNLTTQELVQYCANSHDAFVRKAGERLQEMTVERDTLLTAAVIDTATILRRDEELQMLRAERDAARARVAELEQAWRAINSAAPAAALKEAK